MQRTILVLLAAILTAGAAQAEDKFQRKSGLWEVKRTSTLAGGKVRVTQLCIDQASDDVLREPPEGPGNGCKADRILRDGDQLVIDATCPLSSTKSTAKTHAVITGNPDSTYKIEAKSTFDPPFRGKTEASTVLEGKWTGPCKPDQRPGDVVLPNGARMNLTDVAPPEKPKKKKGGYVVPGYGTVPAPTK